MTDCAGGLLIIGATAGFNSFLLSTGFCAEFSLDFSSTLVSSLPKPGLLTRSGTLWFLLLNGFMLNMLVIGLSSLGLGDLVSGSPVSSDCFGTVCSSLLNMLVISAIGLEKTVGGAVDDGFETKRISILCNFWFYRLTNR